MTIFNSGDRSEYLDVVSKEKAIRSDVVEYVVKKDAEEEGAKVGPLRNPGAGMEQARK